MKKFLSLMLAAGLALSLTACGGNGDAPSATGGAADGTSDQKVLKVVGNVRILPVIRICLHLAKLK